MIAFKCSSCGHRLRVSEKHAGRKGRCPKCSTLLRVPSPDSETPQAEVSVGLSSLREGELHLKQEPLAVPSSATVPDWAQPDVGQVLSKEDAETNRGLRKYPWPIDILFYPASIPGMINLLIFWFLPVLVGPIIAMLWWGMRGRFLGFALGAIVPAYMVYYLANCTHDSVKGGTRAPENAADNPGLGGAFSQFLEVMGVILMIFAPAIISYLLAQETTPLFWTFMAVGIFLLPMGLLAVIFFGSMTGYNPLLWIISIVRTLIPYLGLVLAFAALAAILFYLHTIGSLFPINILVPGPLIYLAMILAHLLGRFYFRLGEHLRWED